MIFAAFVLAAAVAVASGSSCPVTVVSVPSEPSVVSLVSSVSYSYPSLTFIGSAISVVELSSPTVAYEETVIAYYEPYYSSIVSLIESFYSYPSLYPSTYISEVTSAYYSLATAVSYIESVELTQTVLAEYQSTLQSIEVSYPSILTYLYLDTIYSSPSLHSYTEVISQATLTDSSVFAYVLAVTTAVSTSPTVSYAVSYVSSAVYSLPSTVVYEIQTIISSPSTVSSTVLSTIASCYSTLYSELGYVISFTYYYPSVVTDLYYYISAASSISSIGSAVYYVMTSQMPTFTYEVTVISEASSVIPSISYALSVISVIEAESPSIYYAESTIEASFYGSPTVASSIYYALEYPSLVTYPTAIAYEEESHESLVSAIDYIISFETYYTSESTLLTEVESDLTSAFQSYRTLLTAASYVQDITSPSVATATASFLAVKTEDSSVVEVVSSLTYVLSYLPSLSCDEDVIEYYAEAYPYYASYIWDVINSVTYVATSSAVSFQSICDSYTTLYTAVESIVSDEPYYCTLSSLESSFISAAAYDSSLLTQYYELSSVSSSASYSFSTFSSSSSSY